MALVADHHQPLLIANYWSNGMNGIPGSNSGFVTGRLEQLNMRTRNQSRQQCDIEKEGSINLFSSLSWYQQYYVKTVRNNLWR